MRVYLRKIFPHDVTHEVSVTNDIVKEFFSGHTSGMHFVGIKSGESGTVSINSATDPRFGGDFKKILSAEYPSYRDGDIIAIYDKRNNNYSLEVISRLDKRYAVFSEMYKGLERHVITYADSEPEATEDDADMVKGGTNDLYYGVPGSGKSYTIDGIVCNSQYERVVFHPDYTYSDFVGQIMPRLKDNENGEEKLSYEFVPGPFTNALKTALDEKNRGRMVYLIIEEINRGNAPAIFGDIFQLLDRGEDGSSKYCITNYDIAKELFGKENVGKPIRIPGNLTILATMNTSDQNVFTLDTAFQRRWNMKYIPNDVKASEHASFYLDDRNEITWGDFAIFVNNTIVEYNADMSSTEDKQLGAYFVQKGDLNRTVFAEKALKYLWDDVYRMERYRFFDESIKSVGDLVDTYKNADREPLKSVMKSDVYDQMMTMAEHTPEKVDDDRRIEETVEAPVSDVKMKTDVITPEKNDSYDFLELIEEH